MHTFCEASGSIDSNPVTSDHKARKVATSVSPLVNGTEQTVEKVEVFAHGKVAALESESAYDSISEN